MPRGDRLIQLSMNAEGPGPMFYRYDFKQAKGKVRFPTTASIRRIAVLMRKSDLRLRPLADGAGWWAIVWRESPEEERRP